MSDLRVIADLTNTGLKNAESDSHPLSHLVSKEKTVTRTLQKGRQQRYASEHEQSESTCSRHPFLAQSCWFRSFAQGFRELVGVGLERVMLDDVTPPRGPHSLPPLNIRKYRL